MPETLCFFLNGFQTDLPCNLQGHLYFELLQIELAGYTQVDSPSQNALLFAVGCHILRTVLGRLVII